MDTYFNSSWIKYLRVEVLGHSIGVCLRAKPLQRTVPLYIPVSFLVLDIGLFNFSHSDGCEVVCHGGFNAPFPED